MNYNERKEVSRRKRNPNMLIIDNGKTPHTSEDLMALEPEWEVDTGPHVPLFFRPHIASEEQEREVNKKWFNEWRQDLRGDFASVFLLLFLYLLQGIPLGLIASIPLVLQSRHVTYAQQAIFSFAYWPFSLKLLWAPVVDSCYVQRLGRRKSWLIPTQYLIGLFMLVLSTKVTGILGDASSQEIQSPNVLFLMLIFLPLNFLAATQDIAVDGWALTILSRKNVGYASTCNAVGQTAGFFLGNVVFLSLESAEFCNTFLRFVPKPYGLVSLAGFVFFWAWVFILTTTLILLFKSEVDHSTELYHDSSDLHVVDAYKLLYRICRIKHVIYLLCILLTSKIAFAATDGMTGLKLIEMGVPKDKLAGMALFLTPIQVMLPWLIGKYTAGPKPLNIYLKAYPYRILMGGVFALLIWWTPTFKNSDGSFPVAVFIAWIIAYSLHQITTYCIFVSMMAFCAQISDPKVGGTYMTLLNTVNNLGGNWPVTLMLSLADDFTWKDCVMTAADGRMTRVGNCDTKSQETCLCVTQLDGYYILVATCSVLGLFWWLFVRAKIDALQSANRRLWSCL